MSYLLSILGLGVACSLWMCLQLWTGKGSKGNNRWRGGGGCKGHIILVTCSLVLLGCKEETTPSTSTVEHIPYPSTVEHIMSTSITVTAPPDSDAAAKVFSIFHDIDATMSEWKPSSPLTMVNNAAGVMPVRVPEALIEVVQRSIEIAELTSGAFDPTWAALWNLWKFDPESTKQLPSEVQLKKLLPLVDWKAVVLDAERRTMFLPKRGMMLGLGGIAKGVALDKARDALLTKGVENFMIVAGGQVLLQGKNKDRLWRVGIRNPDGTPSQYIGVLSLTNTCVSTSGDYEKFFMLDGKRYHHIIDPRNGYPARGTRSVTVITPDATLADALSTALFVMGPERAMQLVNSLEGVEAVIIDQKNQVHYSSNARDLLSTE